MRHATGTIEARATPRRVRLDLRRAAGLLVLLALLVRAVIPAGFMPVFDSEQRVITVAMCSGHGAQTLPLDDDAPEPDEEASECPFASLTSPAVLKHAANDPVAIRWAHRTLFVSVHDEMPAATTWRPGSPPTGPPALV